MQFYNRYVQVENIFRNKSPEALIGINLRPNIHQEDTMVVLNTSQGHFHQWLYPSNYMITLEKKY